MLPAALAVLLSLAWPSTASAHLGSSKYIRVDLRDEGATLDVEVETVDAAFELGLGERAGTRDVLARGDEVSAWLLRSVRLSSRGGACGGHASAPATIERDGRSYLAVALELHCPPPMRDVVLEDQTVFDDDPRHESLVRMRFGGDTAVHVLRAGQRRAHLGEPPSAMRLFLVFLEEGSRHLFFGYDHLLFLVALLLTAGSLAAREGAKKALADVAIVVTTFTLGHSVTLALAALDVVRLPGRLIETVIAVSILVVALMNVFGPDQRKGMPIVAFGFGLVHGFGFSSVLSELGIPRTQKALALVAFNVGIELAQVVFVVLAFAPLYWAAKKKGYREVVVRGGSIVIAIIATAWIFERLTT